MASEMRRQQMARKVTGAHFIVEFSNKGPRWTQNNSVSVLCTTAERALEIIREHYPDATVHVVRRVSPNTVLLMDKLAAFKEPKQVPARVRAVK